MSKLLKTISVLLTIAILATVAVIPSSALATEITAGNSKEKATNIPQYGVDYVSSLSKAEEVDWFKFTTLSEDAYYEIRLVNYNLNSDWNATWSPNIFLYNTYMQELGSGFTYYENDVIINLKLENNTTYFFKVYMGSNAKDSTGNYQISVSNRFDNVPNEKEKAVLVDTNNLLLNSFDGKGDIDWYKFTTLKSGKHTINLESCDLPTGWNATWSPNIYLYDEYLQELGSDFNYYEKDSVIEAELEANQTYYLKIFMGNNEPDAVGNYKFKITSSDSITPPVTTKTLSNISVITLPKKTDYLIGENLDTTGMAVKAKYSDGTSTLITSYLVSGFDSSKAGTSVVSVSYSENGITKTTSFSVNVNEANNQAPGDDGNGGFSFDDVIEFFDNILAFFAEILQFIIDLFSSLA